MNGWHWFLGGIWEWSAQETLHCNTTSFNKRPTEQYYGGISFSQTFPKVPNLVKGLPLHFLQDFVQTEPSTSEVFSLMSTLVDRPHAKQACLSRAASLSRNQLLYVNCDIFDHITSVLQVEKLAMSICHR